MLRYEDRQSIIVHFFRSWVIVVLLAFAAFTDEAPVRDACADILAGMDADSPACGDFNEDGSITASDALGALNFSVGLGDCPVCICDVDSSGSAAATDALKILRGAVGLAEAFDCPPDGVPLAWSGAGDGFSWADGANWETGIPPTGCEAVTIADTGGLTEAARIQPHVDSPTLRPKLAARPDHAGSRTAGLAP